MREQRKWQDAGKTQVQTRGVEEAEVEFILFLEAITTEVTTVPGKSLAFSMSEVHRRIIAKPRHWGDGKQLRLVIDWHRESVLLVSYAADVWH